MNKNTDNVKDSANEKKSKTAISDHLVYFRDLQFTLSTREGMIAKELAEGLNDVPNIRYYISVSLEYSERYLREVYRLAKEMPEHKIKRSRGALFAYLVKKYAHLDIDH